MAEVSALKTALAGSRTERKAFIAALSRHPIRRSAATRPLADVTTWIEELSAAGANRRLVAAYFFRSLHIVPISTSVRKRALTVQEILPKNPGGLQVDLLPSIAAYETMSERVCSPTAGPVD
jgi:hypothetical protein